MILIFLYSIHIYMLKISCRLSRFLTKWPFCAKVFCATGSISFLSSYSYYRRFLTQLIFCFYCECKQENKFNHAFRIRQTSDKNKEEKNTFTKKEVIKKHEQTLSADLEEEKNVVAPSYIFDVNQHLRY